MNFFIKKRHDMTWPKVAKLGAPKIWRPILGLGANVRFQLKNTSFYKILFFPTNLICWILYNRPQGELAWPLGVKQP